MKVPKSYRRGLAFRDLTAQINRIDMALNQIKEDRKEYSLKHMEELISELQKIKLSPRLQEIIYLEHIVEGGEKK